MNEKKKKRINRQGCHSRAKSNKMTLMQQNDNADISEEPKPRRVPAAAAPRLNSPVCDMARRCVRQRSLTGHGQDVVASANQHSLPCFEV